jgi:RimJ/RimL family protein N-acetyltransferase
VTWLSEHVFTVRDKHRVEAHTRADNVGMRGVLQACGWVQEAYYRRAWPDAEGGWHDATAYALLRDDWRDGARTALPAGEPVR